VGILGSLRVFNFSSQKFLLFQVKICKFIWIYWSCYYFVTFIRAVYGIIFVHSLGV